MQIGEISRDDAWVLELAKVPENMRLTEPELQQTRWFDYRHLLPAQLTYLFVERYKAVYKEIYAQVRDHSDSEKIGVVMFTDVFKSSELLCFWQARQSADSIGCDYDFYLRFALKRAWERGWKYLPRPNQLYGDELVADIRAEWALQCRLVLKLATSEWYKNKNFVGHPDQVSYHAYLVEKIKQREHQHMILARLILKEECLPADIARGYFDNSVVDYALSFYNN